jgi:hypothetical protein
LNIIELLETKFGKGYEYRVIEQNDIASLSLIEVECKEHKLIDRGLFLNLMHRESLCPQCRENFQKENGITVEVSNKKTRTKWELVSLIDKFEEIHQGKFLYHDLVYSYKNMKTPVWIKCIKHNHFFQQTPNNHLNSKICCPICLDEFSKANDTKTKL